MSGIFTAVAGSLAAATAASYTLVYDAINTGSANENNFGDSTNTYYTGEHLYNDSVARNIGRIGVRVAKKAGSITGKTFTVRLWSMSGTALNAELRASEGIAGDDAWTNTTVVNFTFATPYLISTGVDYAVTIDAGGADAANYATCYFNGSGSYATPWPAARGFWRSDKLLFANNSGYNTEMRLYTAA